MGFANQDLSTSQLDVLDREPWTPDHYRGQNRARSASKFGGLTDYRRQGGNGIAAAMNQVAKRWLRIHKRQRQLALPKKRGPVWGSIGVSTDAEADTAPPTAPEL